MMYICPVSYQKVTWKLHFLNIMQYKDTSKSTLIQRHTACVSC